MAATQPLDPATVNDQLRPVRQFISLLSGLNGDQTFATEDQYAINPSSQFQVTGPGGTSTEGKPNGNAGGAMQFPPALIVLGLVAAYLIIK